MCGIAGVLRLHDPVDGTPPPPLEAIPESWLDILDDSIRHRGPDGQGRFRDRAVRDDGTVVDVALVHRRLSILDHAGGGQPMIHDGQRLRPDLTYQPGETPKVAREVAGEAGHGAGLVGVVFNGCIYNHRELRAELEALGHAFGTDHADTEVLVHGWRAWGAELAERAEGMAALAIWDASRGELDLGRDFAGEKPLWTSASRWRSGGVLTFASVPAGLTSLAHSAGFGLDPVPAGSLKAWLRYGASDRPLACARSWPTGYIRSGSVNTGDDGGEEPDRRSAPVDAHRQAALDADELDGCVRRTVASRLEADAPLGVFLSGGIDSGLIAAIARRHVDGLRSFTVRMPDPRIDESGAAAETARAVGTDHTTLDCDASPAEDLVMLIQQMGLPFGDSSLLPTYWVCKAAREHIKVALSGDGGDELFGGYRRHAIAPMLDRWRGLLRLIPDGVLDRRRGSGFQSDLARLAVAARHGGYDELVSIFQTPDLRALARIGGEPLGEDRFRREPDPLRADFRQYLPDDLLRKTDTASMAAGLEVRAPLLARELVEAAMRTRLGDLMPRGERKGLLKRVARRHLPEHIVERPKRGFAIPIGDWLRSDFGGMRQLLHDHLGSSEPFPGLAEAGVEINMDFVRRMLREHDAAGERSPSPWRGRDHCQRLYMLLVLSIWARWLAGVRRDVRAAPTGRT